MARITVEDCLDVVPNRFSLVLVAAERTKQLLKGAHALINNEADNKEVVTALREVAAGKFEIDDSAVIAEDRWKPLDRQSNPEPVDEELPPEA
jgi:DNA-directed RNA polymerase subunit omega